MSATQEGHSDGSARAVAARERRAWRQQPPYRHERQARELDDAAAMLDAQGMHEGAAEYRAMARKHRDTARAKRLFGSEMA